MQHAVARVVVVVVVVVEEAAEVVIAVAVAVAQRQRQKVVQRTCLLAAVACSRSSSTSQAIF